jgi:uncharacterized surface protein with fasciclin (FAS1) repeats
MGTRTTRLAAVTAVAALGLAACGDDDNGVIHVIDAVLLPPAG